ALRVLGRQRVYTDWGFAAKMRKGLGVVALLSGPPGTGKTLTASALADVVGLPLYRVDSSKITSKWIGETEKKLAELFDAAEACNAVLLFDEADSLFGKRTTVNNGNDRYANQEVNFLLQRLESFTGICVLTTNHENAMDEAFRRRLTAHVRIPMPEAAERSELWRTMLPATAPAAANIDFTWLGDRFELSGGYIRNAVLRAAFMASADGCEIDTERLAQAATTEARGMGKVVRG
ncbi:MAG TPA: ATP-binding protein, partial [Kofleriaceae bacterium]|nr:ATP-binding protein [Kofleriaceae bacterium]